MFDNFDFDVIRRSLPYLFYDGMTFTLTLTALSALGGLIFGTLIALMRGLSSYELLGRIARSLCRPDALFTAGAGDLLVLFPGPLYRAMALTRAARASTSRSAPLPPR